MKTTGDLSTCDRVRKHIGVHTDTDLKAIEKAELKQHLLDCPDCQRAYEQMWHTSLILDDLSPVISPQPLLQRIQSQIRSLHRRQRLAFYANPIDWFLGLFRLDPPPTLVNCAAIVFYVLVTAFFVKLTVLDSNDPVALTTKPIPDQMRAVRFGAIKKAALDSVTIEGQPSTTDN